MDAKELIDSATAAMGVSLDELAQRLDYKSLRRARNGEIPLPDSKRKHIKDLVRLQELEAQVNTSFVLSSRSSISDATLHLSPRERLREALRIKGWTTAKLAKEVGYDGAIVENVVNGTGRISEDMAAAFVKALDGALDVAALTAGSDSARIIDPTGFRGTVGDRAPMQLPGKHKTRFVPLLSWAAAGRLENASALDEGYDGEGIMSSVPGRAFGLDIEGDSMSPEIRAGDYAVARYDAEARPGQVVLVKTIQGDVLCKRYTTKDGGRFVILSSVNHSYQPIELPVSEIAWIYPVKQVIRNY